jgi:hypothetical protein
MRHAAFCFPPILNVSMTAMSNWHIYLFIWMLGLNPGPALLTAWILVCI